MAPILDAPLEVHQMNYQTGSEGIQKRTILRKCVLEAPHTVSHEVIGFDIHPESPPAVNVEGVVGGQAANGPRRSRICMRGLY